MIYESKIIFNLILETNHDVKNPNTPQSQNCVHKTHEKKDI